jgi:predicted NAD/FAD-binding protein
MRIGIIGGGIAGISAALELRERGVACCLFEKEDRLGGHAYAHRVGDRQYDMGFVFGGYGTYKRLRALLDKLGAEIQESYLDFSVTKAGRTVYATGCDSDPDLRAECDRFLGFCERYRDSSRYNLLPFGAFLRLHGFDRIPGFIERCIIPPLGLLFITKTGLLQQSTRFVFNMFAGDRRLWAHPYEPIKAWVVRGSTREYTRRVEEDLAGTCRLGTRVTSVTRHPGGVRVGFEDASGSRGEETFDRVILACEGTEIPRIVSDLSWSQRWFFDRIPYETYESVLHRDSSHLAEGELERRYNFLWSEGRYEITANLSRICSYPDAEPVILSIFPDGASVCHIDPGKILARRKMVHLVQSLDVLGFHFLRTYLALETGGIFFASSLTHGIGHSVSFKAGRKSVERALQTTTTREKLTRPLRLATGMLMFSLLRAVIRVSDALSGIHPGMPSAGDEIPAAETAEARESRPTRKSG